MLMSCNKCLYFQESKSLVDILQDFQRENLDPNERVIVVARRRKILHCACVAVSKSYFSWYKVPQIEFVSEMADDYGGPRREFFRYYDFHYIILRTTI